MIIFEIDSTLKDDFDNKFQEQGIQYTIVESTRFDGNTDILTFIVAVTIPTIAALKSIILESIKARQKVRVKYKGLELTGVSENEIKSILDTISKTDNGQR